MDVNVELLTTEKNRTFKNVRIISIVALIFVVIILIVFMVTPDETKEQLIDLFLGVFPISILVLISANLYLMLSKGGIEHLGKLTFSEDGLTITKDDLVRFIELKDLRRMKISLNEYAGEPNVSLNMINPSKLGIENFLWPDISNKEDKFRFKLKSSNHHHRLNNKIREWQHKYPMIEK